MIQRPRTVKTIWRLFALATLLRAGDLPAQNIILHLRNGDRIAGTVLSEATNAVTISNAWVPHLAIPVTQIERRETETPVKATSVATVSASSNVVASTSAGHGPVTVPVTASAPSSWHGEATVGTDAVYGGTTDRQLYYGKVSATYSQPYAQDPKQFFRNTVIYSADYGKTDGILSANDMNGSAKTDMDVNRKVYGYNLGAAGYDEIRKIDLHYEEGPGAGYHLINQGNFAFNAELGANYQHDDRSDDTTVQSLYYRIAENLNWKINRQINLTEKYELFPRADNVSDYRFRFESDMGCGLVLNLFLNLAMIDLYDTQPALGVPSNEMQFRTSLGVKF